MLTPATLAPARLAAETAHGTFSHPKSAWRGPLPGRAGLVSARLAAAGTDAAGPPLGEVDGRGSVSWVSQWLHLATLFAFPPDEVQRPWGLRVQPPKAAASGLVAVASPATPDAAASPDLPAIAVHVIERAQLRASLNRFVYGASLGALAALVPWLPASTPGLAAVIGLSLATNVAAGASRGYDEHARRRVPAAWLQAQATSEATRTRRWLRRSPLGLPPNSWIRPGELPLLPYFAGDFERRGRHVAWGGNASVLAGLLVRSGGAYSRSRDDALEVSGIADGLVCFRLSVGNHTDSRYRLTEGLFVAGGHRGSGERETHTLVVAAAWPSARGLLLQASLRDAYASRRVPDSASWPGAFVEHEETVVSSQGEGWRLPWTLPVLGTVGTGRVRQLVHGVAGSDEDPSEQQRARVTVQGVDESLEHGRRLWQVALDVPPGSTAAGTASAPPAAARLTYSSRLEFASWRSVEAWAASLTVATRGVPPSLLPAATSAPAGWQANTKLFVRCQTSIQPPSFGKARTPLAQAWAEWMQVRSEPHRLLFAHAMAEAGDRAFSALAAASGGEVAAPQHWTCTSETAARLLLEARLTLLRQQGSAVRPSGPAADPSLPPRLQRQVRHWRLLAPLLGPASEAAHHTRTQLTRAQRQVAAALPPVVSTPMASALSLAPPARGERRGAEPAR